VDLQASQTDLTVIAVISPAATQVDPRAEVLDLSWHPDDPDSGFGLAQPYGETNNYYLLWRNAARDNAYTSPVLNTTAGERRW